MGRNKFYRGAYAMFVGGALLGATLMGSPLTSFAQPAENNAGTAAQSSAPAVFVPTSSWLVGPISVQGPAADQDMPCVMVNRFDNGYGVRFSGSDKEILAVAVDFRKDLFNAGDDYDLGLKVGVYDKTLKAVAYDSSTLVMNTERSVELYNQVLDGKSLTVRFGSTDLPFSLLGARDGLTRLSSCYSSPQQRERTRNEQIESTLRQDAVTHSSKSATSAEPIDAIKGFGEGQQGANVATVGESDQGAADAESATDSFGDMLDGFLETAGQNSEASKSGAIVGSAAASGANETARSFPAEARPRPVIGGDDSAQQVSALVPGAMKWQAQQGGNLKDVLNIWTSHKKVGLLWGVNDDFYLPRGFEYQGTFEDAVRAVLSEFSGEALKPRAKLYNDQDTGKAFLLIEYDASE